MTIDDVIERIENVLDQYNVDMFPDIRRTLGDIKKEYFSQLEFNFTEGINNDGNCDNTTT